MKEIFKLLIKEFIEKKLPDVKKRDISIPLFSNKIISIIGIRRSGKTYLLYSLIKQLYKKHKKENIIFINFEDDRLFGITLKNLNDMIEAYFELFPAKRDEKIFLFLDEIQEVENWEKFVRRIYDTLNVSIFITGSSSKLLSKEISTSLRGRTLSFEVFPLSFKEYLNFKKINVDLNSLRSLSFIKNALNEYIKYGGFIEVVNEKDTNIKQRILQDYMDLIIYRDLIERYSIKNLTLLKFLIKYTFSNPATLLSFNKLYNELKSLGFKLSKDTLIEYFSYLEDVYALFRVPIFRNSIREELRNPVKSYIIDTGFFKIFNSSLSEEYSKLYENLVFMHLRRKRKDIYYYKIKREVDFYAGEIINVSYDISNERTLKREINSLLEAMNYFGENQSILITNDEKKEIEIDGKKILIVPLYEWLLNY